MKKDIKENSTEETDCECVVITPENIEEIASQFEQVGLKIGKDGKLSIISNDELN